MSWLPHPEQLWSNNWFIEYKINEYSSWSVRSYWGLIKASSRHHWGYQSRLRPTKILLRPCWGLTEASQALLRPIKASQLQSNRCRRATKECHLMNLLDNNMMKRNKSKLIPPGGNFLLCVGLWVRRSSWPLRLLTWAWDSTQMITRVQFPGLVSWFKAQTIRKHTIALLAFWNSGTIDNPMEHARTHNPSEPINKKRIKKKCWGMLP